MIPEAQKQQMAEAVAKIRETMAAAAKAAGRDPAEVRLCAACKTRTVEEVRYSADLPIDLFGENHVQELVEKTDANAYNGKPGHFIGHLQTNKVNKVVGRAALIQSVDSTRLLDKIDAAAARLGLVQDILVEINIGEEASKSGVDAGKVREALLGGFAYSRILENHGQRMLDRNFKPGFKAWMHQKDMNIVLQEAHRLGLMLPTSAASAQLFNAMVGSGLGEEDSVAALKLLEGLSGD